MSGIRYHFFLIQMSVSQKHMFGKNGQIGFLENSSAAQAAE